MMLIKCHSHVSKFRNLAVTTVLEKVSFKLQYQRRAMTKNVHTILLAHL